MSMGPLGIIAGVAGANYAQRTGSEVDRTQQEVGNKARQVDAAEKSEKASGIGSTEADAETSERDADGRQLLVRQSPQKKQDAEEESQAPRPKDPEGHSGGQLDLSV